MRTNHIFRVMPIAAMAASFAAACTTTNEDPARSQPPAAGATAAPTTVTTDDYRMHCAPAGDHFGVDVFGEGSKLVVHYDFDASDPKGGKMSWGTHEEPLPPEPKRWMSCDSLSKLAGEITKVLPQIERDFGAKASKPLDSWGCDNLPQNIASCGGRANPGTPPARCAAGPGGRPSGGAHASAPTPAAPNGGPPVYECFTP